MDCPDRNESGSLDLLEHTLRVFFTTRRLLEDLMSVPPVSQSQFDADLNSFITAVNNLITAYANAAPNLATEDASVKAALAAVVAADPTAGGVVTPPAS